MAIAAHLRIARSDLITKIEAGNILAYLDNNTTCFMTCSHRHVDVQLTAVDMQIQFTKPT